MLKKKVQGFRNHKLLRKHTLTDAAERPRLSKQDQLQAVLRICRSGHTEEEETCEDRLHDQKIADDLQKSMEVEYPDREPSCNNNLVGAQAVADFYRHYKRLERIKDQNATEKIRSSLYTSVLDKCNEQKILPSKVGLVKYDGKADEVRLGHSRYGRKYLSALSEGLKEANITSCHLNSNRINHQTLEMLSPNFPRSLVSMRLQNNEIGGRGIEAFHRFLKEDIKLVELDLSNNNLTDAGTTTLCSTLQNHQRIRILNLSRNCITCRSAVHLSSLIQSGSFEEIYLQWNRIRCHGGKEILTALTPSLSVRVFDLSWNMIGGSIESCEALCNLIRSNSELVHCDLSGNSFTLEESRLVSETLHHNSTIYGFHFKGNFGHIDSIGNLIVEEGAYARDYRDVCIHNKIESCQLRQHARKDLCETPLRDCCWICEGWLQKQITFESTCEPNLDLWVHFSFEGYQSRYLGRINERTHQFKCMVPPRKVYFFFTYNEQQVTSPTHESVCLYDNSLIKGLELAGQHMDCHVEDRNVFFEGGMGKIIDSQYKILIDVRPRETLATFQREECQIPMKPHHSNSNNEPQENMLEAFEADWQLMRIHSLLANEQAMRIRDTLFNSHLLVRQFYRYYSCLCSTDPNGFFMDQEALRLFLTQSSLLDDELTFEDVIDCLKQVIHASQKDLDGMSYPYDAVTCFRLLELLVRIAPLKYSQYDHCQALELLLLGLKKRQSCTLEPHEKFRRNLYRPEQCDSLLRRSKTILEQLFFENCSSYWRLGEKKFIYFEDFKDIFDRNGTTDKYELSVKQLRLAFFYAKQQPINYYETDGFRRLYLGEFAEALGRAAWLSDCEAYRQNHLIGLQQKVANIVESVTQG